MSVNDDSLLEDEITLDDFEEYSDMPFLDDSEEYSYDAFKDSKISEIETPSTSNNLNKTKSEEIGINQVSARNEIMTNLLKSFSDDYYLISLRVRQERKIVFWATLIFFGLLVVSGIICAILAGVLYNDKLQSILLVVYATISVISSVIALPTVIVKHLFPQEKDSRIVEVLNSIIKNDCQIREVYYTQDGNKGDCTGCQNTSCKKNPSKHNQ